MANSPVSHEYSYSYKFEIRGVFYDGDSKNSKLKLGDTIVVKYVADRPEINEPVE